MRSLRAYGILGAAIVTATAAPSPAGAADVRIVAERQVAPRVVELTITTPAFTTPTKVDVDLPTGYDADPARRWPVTYVLAGMMNTYRTFNSLVDGAGLTKDYPSIVVSPNGDSGYWSDWYNAGGFGPPMYETYVTQQLIPLIDRRFRTDAGRAHRAVLGISMGGYGSLMIAARHPDLFAAAASLSGSVDTNLAPNAAALSAGPTFQNAAPDAIYGPRATQEIRWHGHNPADLAANLRDLDLQVRTANGALNPAIGEKPASADSVSCLVEAGVYAASVSLHDRLTALHVPHLWRNYGAGCHSPSNFKRELADTFTAFAKVLADPPRAPASFSYRSIEPAFDVWGWRVAADADRAVEFLRLDDVSAAGLTLTGTGRTTVRTPPLFGGLRQVDVRHGAPQTAIPDGDGRITFSVDLGAPDRRQEDTPGAPTARVSRTVAFAPHAVVRASRLAADRRRVRVCVRARGGAVTARLTVRDARGRMVARAASLTVPSSHAACRALRWTRRPLGPRVTLRVAGTDGFGHAVSARRSVRLG